MIAAALTDQAPPEELSDHRSISPLPMSGVEPSIVSAELPRFEWVDPHTLKVEGSYQRNLSDKSFRLIRRIVADWDWRRMKPPIVALNGDGSMCVVDGQHTAIAAASHPGIAKIPVMIVPSITKSDRAASFMGHNRDRVAMTPAQMHFASVVAGDEVAIAVRDACLKAGVKICRFNPPNGDWAVGDTVAIKSLERLVGRKGVFQGARVLTILVQAQCAPIRSDEINAVTALLFDAEHRGLLDEAQLALTIRSKSHETWAGIAESQVRKGRKMPLWRAISIAWFKATPKKRAVVE